MISHFRVEGEKIGKRVCVSLRVSAANEKKKVLNRGQAPIDADISSGRPRRTKASIAAQFRPGW